MIAERLLELLHASGQTLSIAESVTGGAIAKAITDVPGSSSVFLGGLVTYATESKVSLLGISREVIDRHGVVSQEVALEMARSVRAQLGSTWAIATTGVAGPGPHHGIPAGVVWIAISGPSEVTERLALGDIGRDQVRAGAVTGALALLSRILRPSQPR